MNVERGTKPVDARVDYDEKLKAGAETDATSGLDGTRCLVTTRDRELLALLSMTRYLTTAQANALVRPGRDESVGRRRLFTLAGLRASA